MTDFIPANPHTSWKTNFTRKHNFFLGVGGMWGSHHIEPASHYIVHSITLIIYITHIAYHYDHSTTLIIIIMLSLMRFLSTLTPYDPDAYQLYFIQSLSWIAWYKLNTINIIILYKLTITLHSLKYNTLNLIENNWNTCQRLVYLSRYNSITEYLSD